MSLPIRTIQYGLGPIGAAILRAALQRPGIEIVGAVDIDPGKIGRDVGEVAGLDRPLGITVAADAASLMRDTRPRLVLHSTVSSLAAAMPQLVQCVEAGARVISTCEELSYPAAQHPEIAKELDLRAKLHRVAVLGTGVNPGFVMDVLPIMLTAVCQRVDRIEIKRVVDAAQRRLPLQQKIGAGLSLEQFGELARSHKIRHVGLLESLRMVADALEWKLDQVSETLDPVVAERVRRSPHITVQPGQAAGVHQRAVGRMGGREVIVLDLRMYLEAEDAGDSVQIEGIPGLSMNIPGGVHGDMATAAVVVNAIPRVLAARPGLLTMQDLPPVHAWAR